MPLPAAAHTVRVWDLPTRAFHWLLAACVIGLVVTGKIGGALMDWHARFGYLAGSLLLFRLAWGFAGGHWSRFASFVPGPRAIASYLRSRTAKPAVGHNPLGALSVLAMLGVLLAQAGTGMFSANIEDFSGPLSHHLGEAAVKAITRYHKGPGQASVLVLVALHVAAIAWYRLRSAQDLVGPMWHGDKTLDSAAPGSRDDARSRWLALALFIASLLVMGTIWGLGMA